MESHTDQHTSKASQEPSSLVFAFVPMALVLAVGASWYLLAATGAEGSPEVPFILTLGLAVAFGASMSKV